MGCDIHGFWEAKTPSGDWIAFRDINDSRSYMWFGIIADVRIPVASETARRGIPTTTSPLWQTYCTRWDRGLHSHTYLTPAEVVHANVLLVNHYLNEDLPPPSKMHEIVPSLTEEIENLFLPSKDSASDLMIKLKWTGTLADLIGDVDIDQHVRMVIAFDN